MLDENFIDGLIKRQYRSKHFFALLAATALCVGLIGIAWLIQSRHEAELLNLLSILIAAIGLVPWKEIRICNEKIETLEMLKVRLHGLCAPGVSADAERNRIEELLWRSLENAVSGD